MSILFQFFGVVGGWCCEGCGKEGAEDEREGREFNAMVSGDGDLFAWTDANESMLDLNLVLEVDSLV